MQTQNWLLGAVAGAILIGSLIGAGCKSSSSSNANATKTQSPSAEDYFSKLVAITQDAKTKEDAAQPLNTAVANLSPDQVKQTGTTFLNNVITILESESTQVKGLQPPPELQGEHTALVKELDNLVTALRSFADQAKSVPATGIQNFLKTTAFAQSTFASLDAACSALETTARSKNIDANLGCPGEQASTPAQQGAPTPAPVSTTAP